VLSRAVDTCCFDNPDSSVLCELLTPGLKFCNDKNSSAMLSLCFVTDDNEIGRRMPWCTLYAKIIPNVQSVFTARRSYASAVLGVVILYVCLYVCRTRAL